MFFGTLLPFFLLLLCVKNQSDEFVDLSGHGPEFIIIGCACCGTSSMQYNLDQHNDIFSVRDPHNIIVVDRERFAKHVEIKEEIGGYSWLKQRYKGNRRSSVRRTVRKEMHFFDESYSRGITHYRNIFKEAKESISLELEREDSPFLLFEKTPKYFCDREVPKRIHQDFPDMKFILMLRNPVDRIYSGTNRIYDQMRRYDINFTPDESDEEECASYGDEKDLCLMRNWVEREIVGFLDSGILSSDDGCDYLSKGRYWEQLQRWFSYFNEDQFFIIRSEDYFNDPRGVFDDILRFFNVSSDYEIGEMKWRNKRYCLPMRNEVRRKLMAYYEESNKILYQMVGRDYEWETLNMEKLLINEKVACDEQENCDLGGSGDEEVIMNFLG